LIIPVKLSEAQRVSRWMPWILVYGCGGSLLLFVVGPQLFGYQFISRWVVMGFVNVLLIWLGLVLATVRSMRRWLILPGLGLLATDLVVAFVR
jgi:hypothetical protein